MRHIPLVPEFFTRTEKILWELSTRLATTQNGVLGSNFGSAMQKVSLQTTLTLKLNLNPWLRLVGRLDLNLALHGLRLLVALLLILGLG